MYFKVHGLLIFNHLIAMCIFLLRNWHWLLSWIWWYLVETVLSSVCATFPVQNIWSRIFSPTCLTVGWDVLFIRWCSLPPPSPTSTPFMIVPKELNSNRIYPLVYEMTLAYPDVFFVLGFVCFLQTPDFDLCDEVTGKVSLWWFIYSRPVCAAWQSGEPQLNLLAGPLHS